MCIEKKKKAVLGFFGASGAFLYFTTDCFARLLALIAIPSFFSCREEGEEEETISSIVIELLPY
jgi:hypothetical protein